VLTFDILCEQRIAEAMRQGEFDGLPGAGQPLDLDEDPLVPAEQRMTNRILKNAGYLPPELGLRKEIAELRAQLEALGEDLRAPAVRRLAALMLQLSLSRGQTVNLAHENQYWERLKQKAA
jgi:hypothetical protein